MIIIRPSNIAEEQSNITLRVENGSGGVYLVSSDNASISQSIANFKMFGSRIDAPLVTYSNGIETGLNNATALWAEAIIDITNQPPQSNGVVCVNMGVAVQMPTRPGGISEMNLSGAWGFALLLPGLYQQLANHPVEFVLNASNPVGTLNLHITNFFHNSSDMLGLENTQGLYLQLVQDSTIQLVSSSYTFINSQEMSELPVFNMGPATTAHDWAAYGSPMVLNMLDCVSADHPVVVFNRPGTDLLNVEMTVNNIQEFVAFNANANHAGGNNIRYILHTSNVVFSNDANGYNFNSALPLTVANDGQPVNLTARNISMAHNGFQLACDNTAHVTINNSPNAVSGWSVSNSGSGFNIHMLGNSNLFGGVWNAGDTQNIQLHSTSNSWLAFNGSVRPERIIGNMNIAFRLFSSKAVSLNVYPPTDPTTNYHYIALGSVGPAIGDEIFTSFYTNAVYNFMALGNLHATGDVTVAVKPLNFNHQSSTTLNTGGNLYINLPAEPDSPENSSGRYCNIKSGGTTWYEGGIRAANFTINSVGSVYMNAISHWNYNSTNSANGPTLTAMVGGNNIYIRNFRLVYVANMHGVPSNASININSFWPDAQTSQAALINFNLGSGAVVSLQAYNNATINLTQCNINGVASSSFIGPAQANLTAGSRFLVLGSNINLSNNNWPVFNFMQVAQSTMRANVLPVNNYLTVSGSDYIWNVINAAYQSSQVTVQVINSTILVQDRSGSNLNWSISALTVNNNSALNWVGASNLGRFSTEAAVVENNSLVRLSGLAGVNWAGNINLNTSSRLEVLNTGWLNLASTAITVRGNSNVVLSGISAGIQASAGDLHFNMYTGCNITLINSVVPAQVGVYHQADSASSYTNVGLTISNLSSGAASSQVSVALNSDSTFIDRINITKTSNLNLNLKTGANVLTVTNCANFTVAPSSVLQVAAGGHILLGNLPNVKNNIEVRFANLQPGQIIIPGSITNSAGAEVTLNVAAMSLGAEGSAFIRLSPGEVAGWSGWFNAVAMAGLPETSSVKPVNLIVKMPGGSSGGYDKSLVANDPWNYFLLDKGNISTSGAWPVNVFVAAPAGESAPNNVLSLRLNSGPVNLYLDGVPRIYNSNIFVNGRIVLRNSSTLTLLENTVVTVLGSWPAVGSGGGAGAVVELGLRSCLQLNMNMAAAGASGSATPSGTLVVNSFSDLSSPKNPLSAASSLTGALRVVGLNQGLVVRQVSNVALTEESVMSVMVNGAGSSSVLNLVGNWQGGYNASVSYGALTRVAVNSVNVVNMDGTVWLLNNQYYRVVDVDGAAAVHIHDTISSDGSVNHLRAALTPLYRLNNVGTVVVDGMAAGASEGMLLAMVNVRASSAGGGSVTVTGTSSNIGGIVGISGDLRGSELTAFQRASDVVMAVNNMQQGVTITGNSTSWVGGMPRYGCRAGTYHKPLASVSTAGMTAGGMVAFAVVGLGWFDLNLYAPAPNNVIRDLFPAGVFYFPYAADWALVDGMWKGGGWPT